MVRVLHFADVHLGAESYGRLDPKTGLSTRLGDFLAALDRIVQYALGNDIHCVLFAGDAYKTCDPSPTHQREFAKRIAQIGRAGIPVILLTGNHDVPRTSFRANTIEIFEAVHAENVHVADTPGVLKLETRGGQVQVLALPWFNRSALLAKEDYRDKSMDEVHAAIVDRLDRGVSELVKQLDPGIPTIFLAHGTILGAQYSSEQRTILGQEVLLPARMFTHPTVDYVALGHVHKHQVLNERPPVVYSGSIERIDFGEEKEDKGFVVAEVERGHTEYRFISLGARRFVTINVEVDKGDPMEAIRAEVGKKRAEIRDAVVRLFIRTPHELEHLVDERELRELLKDCFHVSIVRDVQRGSRTRLGSGIKIEALKPRELLEKYLQVKGTPPERIQRLLECADRIMDGR